MHSHFGPDSRTPYEPLDCGGSPSNRVMHRPCSWSLKFLATSFGFLPPSTRQGGLLGRVLLRKSFGFMF